MVTAPSGPRIIVNDPVSGVIFPFPPGSMPAGSAKQAQSTIGTTGNRKASGLLMPIASN